MDVGGWLRGLGLERYETAFRENDISISRLKIGKGVLAAALLPDRVIHSPEAIHRKD